MLNEYSIFHEVLNNVEQVHLVHLLSFYLLRQIPLVEVLVYILVSFHQIAGILRDRYSNFVFQ